MTMMTITVLIVFLYGLSAKIELTEDDKCMLSTFIKEDVYSRKVEIMIEGDTSIFIRHSPTDCFLVK